MKRKKESGSVLLIVVFAVALTAALTAGLLELNTQNIQISRNHKCIAQARATAYAGLENALAKLHKNGNWNDGFENKSFEQNKYTVTVNGTFPNYTINSSSVTADGYKAALTAKIKLSSGPVHNITITQLRIN